MEIVAKIVVENTIKRLEQSILEYNPKAIDFKCEYETKENFIFMIGYSRVIMEYGDAGIYRMICMSIYGEKIFQDGNVIDYDKMYNIDDVIRKTKGYFSHYLKQLNQL